MNPVWLLCLSNLRKKKIQNAIIALVIFLSALLLSTAFVVLNNTGDVFSNIHKKVNGSHQILNFENGLHNPDDIHDWWKNQEGVSVTNLLHYKRLARFTYEGKEISNINLFMINTQDPSEVDKLIFAQGSNTIVPEKGTIWIPTSLAYSKGIEIGDRISFQTTEGEINLKVSAVVIDLPYNQPFTITARIWMNPEDYTEKISTTEEAEMAMMGLRFDNISEEGMYWSKFKQYFGIPFLESLTDFSGISSFYLIVNQVISFVMIFLAFIMILIAIITIGFTISDAVLSNYKTIGILKSTGLSSAKVVQIYVTQYTLLSIVSVIPGILLSYFFSRTVITMSLSYLKTDNSSLDINFMGSAILIGSLVVVIIGLTAMIFSFKARSIKPAQAIRYGMSEKNISKKIGRLNPSQNKFISFEKFPAPFILSIRGILKDIRGSVLILFITSLTTSVLIFGFVLIHSIDSMQQTRSEWGYDSSDVSIEILNPESLSVKDLEEEFSGDKRVESMAALGGTYSVIAGDSSPKSLTRGIQITTSSSDFDKIGYKNIVGENPKRPDEISIGINVAKSLDKGIGDTIEVYILGEKGIFTVTGIYQSLANMANSGRVTLDALTKLGIKEKHVQTLYMINLNKGVSANQFVKEVSRKYGGDIFIATQETLVKETFSQALPILISPLTVIGLFFIIVTFGITYSINRIKIYKESKVYGIYKSLGMSAKNIRLSIALSSFLLAGAGSIIGSLVGIKVLPNFLNLILSGYGIVNFPLVINWLFVLAIVPIAIITVSFGSWRASKMIKNSSLRILVQ